MFQSIRNISSYITFYPKTQEHEKAQEFYSHLNSSEDAKTAEFIQNHPSVINTTFSKTSMSAFDLSLSQRNIENMKNLIAYGANVNKPNNYGISSLDNLLLIKNQNLFKKVFGNALGTLLSDAQSQVDSSPFSDTILSVAQSQIKKIKEEMSQYSDLTDIKNALKDFLPLIESNSYEILEDKLKEASELNIFDLAVYSLFTHNNELLKKLYEYIGPDFLSLETLDLKNLYQLAAMADNSDAIRLFYKWGLAPSHQLISPSQHSFSAYHYAIFCPSLTTFLTLLEVGVPMPPPAPLQAFSFGIRYVREKLECFTFSPIQLLVHRAAIIDPLAKEGHFDSLLLFIEVLALFGEFSVGFSQEIKMLLGLYRTSYFLGSSFQTLFNPKGAAIHLSILAASLVTLSQLFEIGLVGTVLPSVNILPYLKYFTTLMTVKKVWNDFSSVYQSYSYRPLKSAWYFSKAIMSHFLYFKHTYFQENESFKAFEKASKEYQNENGRFNHIRSKPFHTYLPKETPPSVNINEVKESVKNLSYSQLKKCGEETRRFDIFKCLLGEYHGDPTSISKKDLNGLISIISKKLHPNKTDSNSKTYKEIVSMCKEKQFNDLWNNYFIGIVDKYFFNETSQNFECEKLADTFHSEMSKIQISISQAQIEKNGI